MTEQFPENKAFSNAELMRDRDLTAELHEPVTYSFTPKSAYTASMKASKALFSDIDEAKRLGCIVNGVYDERNDLIFDLLKRLDTEGQKLEESHQS